MLTFASLSAHRSVVPFQCGRAKMESNSSLISILDRRLHTGVMIMTAERRCGCSTGASMTLMRLLVETYTTGTASSYCNERMHSVWSVLGRFGSQKSASCRTLWLQSVGGGDYQ